MLKPRFLLFTGLLSVAVFVGTAADQRPKLPPPFHTPSVNNPPRVIERPEGARLQVPQGFNVEEYAADFQRPRFMLLGPSNEILITDSTQKGAVYVLTNNGKNRKALIEGLDRPYGMAFWKEFLYVAEPTSVKRYKYNRKAMTVGAGEQIVSMPDFAKGHWTRSILFDRKGTKFYLGVGSESNVASGEHEQRAAINRYNPDGSGHEIFAAGTRNPIGMHWYPGTDDLWAAVQERDLIGDDLVPDFFIRVRQGGFYGWPYAYIGPNEDPRNKGKRSDLVQKTIVPDVVLGPHVAVLDFTFYTGKQFPAEYRGGAFLAFHGSWNRSQRIGYSVVFVPFKGGKPAGEPRDFMTGWMLSPDQREVWGRPVAVLQLQDGSLLVSDDGGKKIWRISYKG
jgi:glucose/arabinose dehydrogenase